MILTAPHLMLALRWVPPAIAIMGSTATYLTVWTVIRTVTLPFPDRFYRRAEEKLYSAYQSLVGFFYETWSGVEFCFYGDRPPNTPENALYISNHQCTVDWVIAEVLCVKQGGYGGRARYILKDALKYIPLYGWQLGDRGSIYIKRQKTSDQTRLIRGLNAFVERNLPVWLVIFPEGTRFDPRNRRSIERSHEFARKLGLPELEHVLTPKTAGFEMALGHIRDHFNAVYDLTIYYEGFTRGSPVRVPAPDLFGFFSGRCARVHIHIRRIPIEEIPKTPDEQRSWMYKTYINKDRMIEHCMTSGSFDAPRVSHPLPLNLSGPPTLIICAVLIGALSTHWGRRWWIGTVAFFSIVGIVNMAVKS